MNLGDGLGVVLLDVPGAPYFYGAVQVLEQLCPARVVLVVRGEVVDGDRLCEAYPGLEVVVHPIYEVLSVTLNRVVQDLAVDLVFFWDPNVLVHGLDWDGVLAVLGDVVGFEVRRLVWEEFVLLGDMAGVPYAVFDAMLVRRSAFLDVGGWDPLMMPVFGGDVALGFRMARAGFHVVVSDVVIFHRKELSVWERELPLDYCRQMRLRNAYLIFWEFERGGMAWIWHVLGTLFRCLTFQIAHFRAVIKALWVVFMRVIS